MKSLILASKSPRRKELLEKCGIPFTVEAAEIDETLNSSLPLTEAIHDLSRRKAEAILKIHPESVVLGSDTIVVVDGMVLGKPEDHEEAKQMLRKLSGRSHQVITGFCLMSSLHCHTEASVSEVYFSEMTEEEIAAYVATNEADDKAGAYGIQGLAGKFIARIEGDYYTIVGLPLAQVYQELKNLAAY